ncbi:MAG: hypothetical protein IH609_15835 [Dehalococcoidia bacterium]|nr:hypothetical protein [Dehalococcoidia bacterium]
MLPFALKLHLDAVARCPLTEESRQTCGEFGVIPNGWVTLAGWGNPVAKVAFVGINPRLGSLRARRNQIAQTRHQVQLGESREECAERLATAGFADDSHFELHRSWLQHVRFELPDANIPPRLDEFAFFTESAFCASAGQPDEFVTVRCFSAHTRQLLLDFDFRVLVAVGSQPLARILGEPVKGFHGESWKLPDGRLLVGSFQPADALQRPQWQHLDPLAPAKRLVELHRGGTLLI